MTGGQIYATIIPEIQPDGNTQPQGDLNPCLMAENHLS